MKVAFRVLTRIGCYMHERMAGSDPNLKVVVMMFLSYFTRDIFSEFLSGIEFMPVTSCNH